LKIKLYLFKIVSKLIQHIQVTKFARASVLLANRANRRSPVFL